MTAGAICILLLIAWIVVSILGHQAYYDRWPFRD